MSQQPSNSGSSRDVEHDADLATVDAGGCTAAVVDAHAEVVRTLLIAGEPHTWPGLAPIKQSTVRTVLRGRVHAGLDVHVKLYRAVRWTDQARDLLLGARARGEFENLRRARALGLPAAEPIAYGATSAKVGRSFLVTRSIAATNALPRGPWPAATAATAGELLRRAHDCGLHAFDLHPENMVADERGRCWLVDLTSAHFGAALDLPARAHALAFFLLDLDGGPGHPGAAPLLSAYGASPALRTATESAWRRLRRQALAAFGRRAGRACRHTAVDVAPGQIVFRHLPAGALADDAVAQEAKLLELPPAKTGRRGSVWLLDTLAAKQRPRAAARRLFRAAYWLIFAGVPCPRPLALVQRRGSGVVLTQRVPAPDLAQRIANDRLSAAEAVAAAATLGDAVGRLHGHGLRNRDLKLENLVLDPTTGQVLMADLDGVTRRRAKDGRAQAADLGRLLAAFVAARSPGGTSALRAFMHRYYRARQCLEHDRPTLAAQRFQRRRIADNARRRQGRVDGPRSAFA